MSRKKDNSGVPQTCPWIDDVIAFIKSVEDLKDVSSKEACNAIDSLERVRSANSELRDWGNEQDQRADEAEKEKENFESEVDRLKDEIKELNNTVKELETAQ